MNFWGSGPMYFEIGLIIFFIFLCSIMWAAQPDVLEITKMGVKNSLHYWKNTCECHIGDRHWLQRSRDLDIFSFRWSFCFQCSLKCRQGEAFRKAFWQVQLTILLLCHFLDLPFCKYDGQNPSPTVSFATFLQELCLILTQILWVQGVSLLLHWLLHVKVLSKFQWLMLCHYKNQTWLIQCIWQQMWKRWNRVRHTR